MPITVEAIDTRAAPEAKLRELHRLHLQRERDEYPDDPEVPWARRLTGWRNPRADADLRNWVAWDGDVALGTIGTHAHPTQNLENAEVWVWVDPAARGRGAARALWTPVLDHLEADGRIRIDTFILEGRPGEALAERAGLRRVYTERLSRAIMADVDRDLLADWVRRAPERAAGYSLLRFDAPLPPEYVEPFCAVTNLMHTAPKEDAVEEDVFLTPEDWAEWERGLDVRGVSLHVLVAVEDATGHWAGYTAIGSEASMPWGLEQWDTAVDPDHRNKGLGRWMKAALFLEVADRYPDARWIDTWNADSNEAMLAINVAMGFHPYWTGSSWQGMTADVREALGA
ncbi:MAG: GNAT family N-acetyltransferase [Acidimicrobiia bacterium]|nr:GNAT family N-acetyltransferase [Acidimicrobiia bacterium]